MQKSLKKGFQNFVMSLKNILIGLIPLCLLISLTGCVSRICFDIEKEPIDCQNNIKYNSDMAECLAKYVEKY